MKRKIKEAHSGICMFRIQGIQGFKVFLCVTEQGTVKLFFSGVIECSLRLQVMSMSSYVCVFTV